MCMCMYASARAHTRARIVYTDLYLYVLFHLLVGFDSIRVGLCHMYKHKLTHTHKYAARDTYGGMLKWKVKFPEKTRTYNNFGMCQTNKRMAEQKTNNSSNSHEEAKQRETETKRNMFTLRHTKDIYVLPYDS